MKTALMIREEARLGRPLKDAIPEAYEQCGSIEKAALRLGMPASRFYLFTMRLGMEIGKIIRKRNTNVC